MMPQRAGGVGGTIALLGRHGLATNDSTQKYTLPGQFSGLHLVWIMFAAFKRLAMPPW